MNGRLCSKSRVAGRPPLKRRPLHQRSCLLPRRPQRNLELSKSSRLARNLPSFRRKKRRQPQARQIPSLKSLRSSLLQNRPKKLRHAKTPEPGFELEQDFELVLDPEPLLPAYDQKPPETRIAPPQREPVTQNAALAPPAGSGFASDQFLADLANEIDGLELDKLSPSFSGSMPGTPSQAPATRDSAPTAPITTGPLKEVFDEFRAELGEMGAEEEDLETHYNLGIAFREMG